MLRKLINAVSRLYEVVSFSKNRELKRSKIRIESAKNWFCENSWSIPKFLKIESIIDEVLQIQYFELIKPIRTESITNLSKQDILKRYYKQVGIESFLIKGKSEKNEVENSNIQS